MITNSIYGYNWLIIIIYHWLLDRGRRPISVSLYTSPASRQVFAAKTGVTNIQEQGYKPQQMTYRAPGHLIYNLMGKMCCAVKLTHQRETTHKSSRLKKDPHRSQLATLHHIDPRTQGSVPQTHMEGFFMTPGTTNEAN